jgi:PKD repeat protein
MAESGGDVEVLNIARRTVITVVLLGLAAVALVLAPPASATTGDVGHQDQSYSGAAYEPTSDKPQSKLWYAHNAWWADMFDTVSRTWHIFRLDRSSQTWVDTAVPIDDRADSLADVLWDGTHLYVASHVVTISSDTATVPSKSGAPARLYRYSYSSSSGSYVLDAGFPVAINDNSSESLTLDKDSTGELWATWTQVSGSASTGYTGTVYANSTTGSDTSWGTPFVLPGAEATVEPDDISSVVAFGHNRTGIMWSNQLDGGVYWAVHKDGAARDSWQVSPAVRGSKQSDDHINIKAVQADTSGRVFAVVKTSLDGSPSATPTDPQIELLSFKPGTGAWSVTVFGTLADCHTRPQLVLDEEQQTLNVFATAPSSGGCSYAGQPGTIYEKTSPMDNPSFVSGRGTPVIRDAASANLNNVTTTKQSVTSASGIVVLAGNAATKRYWHADLSLAATSSSVAPTASFTSSVTSGEVPLGVQFTDTSTGAPTSWSWDFGDGSTASAQNPAHTYTAVGTYTVTLVSSNATGISAPVTGTETVRPQTIKAGGSTTAGASTATTAVTIARPAGAAAGTLLAAQITADLAPGMSTVPAGWTQVLAGPLTIGGNARVFVYSHVVSDPAAEPAAYTWQLSLAEKFNAGMTVFSGVDGAHPFDTAASTAMGSSYTATTLTVPGVTTVTDGAVVIGGLGLDSKSIAVTQPAGWGELWESTGGQVAELASRGPGAAGATGPVTWSIASGTASTGWIRALRPAATAGPPPAAAVPTASFTSSVSGGQAPLAVQFTDTSTGSPTAWAWDFGDGSTATVQNPAHTFASAGTYTVKLTATNGAGSSSTASATVTVSVPPAAVPTATFTSSVSGGQAPLAVQFTDTSTGSPTAWAWDFGDGSTATVQNPAHTFASAATYTVKLTATNGAGSSSPASATVTVSAPAPRPSGRIVVGASTTAGNATASSDVTIAEPTGVGAGTLLIAQITADGAPAMGAVPTGWTAVLAGPLTVAGNARLFVFSHVVTDPAAEPASYGWQLATPQKWNAGMTAFAGVDTANPFDSASSTAVNTNYSAKTLTVPGVSTVTASALLIGGVGLDSKSITVAPPSGWSEAWESTGAQVSELALDQPAGSGPTGPITWSMSAGIGAGGWVRALRPAPAA